MSVLWLDDIRKPWEHGFLGAEWAKTAEEAIALLKTGRIEFASLDHDLSEAATMGMADPKEKTGMTVLDWLEENPEYWPVNGVRIHTMNPYKYHVMRGIVLKHYGRNF